MQKKRNPRKTKFTKSFKGQSVFNLNKLLPFGGTRLRIRKLHSKSRSVAKPRFSLDERFFVLTGILTILGLIAVADASAPSALANFDDKYYFLKQQLVSAGIGCVLLVFFSTVKYTVWKKLAFFIFIFGLLLLIAVLMPGFGGRFLGARRWLIVGAFTFQPSEFIKLALAIYLASLVSKKSKVISLFIPIGIVCALVMLQPDLGTTMVIAGIAMAQIFLSGIPILYFFFTAIAGVVASLVLIISSDYRRSRLVTFLSQSRDPLGESYHLRQILLALGSGGLLGTGLGQSRQKYLFLPETATDSIFAVIAEELGFIGSVALIGIFVLFIFQGLKIMRQAPDDFSKILAAGLVAWLGGQMVLNIATMVSLVPLTGIPLPFFSYGGSSLMMVLSACGLLLNISKYSVQKGKQ